MELNDLRTIFKKEELSISPQWDYGEDVENFCIENSYLVVNFAIKSFSSTSITEFLSLFPESLHGLDKNDWEKIFYNLNQDDNYEAFYGLYIFLTTILGLSPLNYFIDKVEPQNTPLKEGILSSRKYFESIKFNRGMLKALGASNEKYDVARDIVMQVMDFKDVYRSKGRI